MVYSCNGRIRPLFQEELLKTGNASMRSRRRGRGGGLEHKGETGVLLDEATESTNTAMQCHVEGHKRGDKLREQDQEITQESYVEVAIDDIDR
ncbi:hypothetical protein B296_00019692 [Ensete ventricosum]|uniref:Uncharacterized protein n=1 Tax=Ensete ventricosum TaxID=4639 RepID=A0A426XN18_ENSVE|nr:hypothetical protein B296_00019692 [Ensete ventricosum]